MGHIYAVFIMMQINFFAIDKAIKGEKRYMGTALLNKLQVRQQGAKTKHGLALNVHVDDIGALGSSMAIRDGLIGAVKK